MTPPDWVAVIRKTVPILLLMICCHDGCSAVYLGCYHHPPRRHFSILSDGNGFIVSPITCQSDCRRLGYEYSGLTQGEYCFCAASPPDISDLASESNCTMPCSGDGSEICGAFQYFSVYGRKIPIRGLQLRATPVVQTNSAVEFTFTTVERPTNLSLELNFGDDSGWTPNAVNITSGLQRRFTKPGTYITTLRANNNDDLPNTDDEKLVQTKVIVQAPAEGIFVNCTEFAMTDEPLLCNGTLDSGTYPSLNLRFVDGSEENISLPNIEWVSAGPAIPEHGSFTSSSVSNKFYAMPSSQFEENGQLRGWEFYAVGTGDVQLMVLRPLCSGNEYCFKDNHCVPMGTCTPHNVVMCSGSDLFCPMRLACVPNPGLIDASCNDTFINRYDSSVTLPTAYAVVFEESVTLATPGWHWRPTSDPEIAVQKGDIIGFSSTSSILATRAPTNERDDLEISGPTSGTVGSSVSSWSASGLRHHVRGLASQPINFQFSMVIRTFGENNITVTAFTEELETQNVSTVARIIVAIGINVTEIVAPAFGATSKNVLFDLAPHTGSNVTYVWDFGNGVNITTENGGIQYAFPEKGCYNVSVRAYNLLQSKENQTEICIQDEITGVSLDANTSTVNVNTSFMLTMSSGSDYTCEWNMSDGTVYITDAIQTPTTGSPWYHTYIAEIASPVPVLVNCSNVISFDVDELQHSAYWPVNTVSLVREGANLKTPTNLEVQIDQGTRPNFDVKFNSINLPCTYDPSSLIATSDGYIPASSLGIYLVEVEVSNLVSSVQESFNFTFELPIKNPTLTTNPLDRIIIARGVTVDFTVDMEEGSGASVVWDYDDGNQDEHVAQAFDEWSNPIMKSHTFQRLGDSNVTVTISNSYQEFVLYRIVSILVGIENVTFMSDSPVPYTQGQGVISTWFEVDGVPPNRATVKFNWGDGESSDILIFSEDPQRYTHTYSDAGVYQVTAEIKNPIDTKELPPLNVSVVKPVSNMMLHVTPEHVPVNQQVAVCVSMEEGDQVNITTDFDDGSTPVVQERVGTTPYYKDCVYKTFTVDGAYNMSVTARNALGNTTKIYTILVQNPVTDAFTLTSSAPTSFPDGKINITLSYPSNETLPDDAFVLINFGDGTQPFKVALDIGPPSYSMTFSHTYAEAGDYSVSTTVQNKASSLDMQTSGGAYEDFENVEVKAVYKPELPIGAEFKVPSSGVFPTSRPIMFQVTKTKGTIVSYDIMAVHANNDEVASCYGTITPEITLSKGGTYSVNVTVTNPLFSHLMQLTVITGVTTEGIFITDNDVTAKSGEQKLMWVTFDVIDVDACIAVDFGDGTVSYYEQRSGQCTALTGTDSASMITIDNKTLNISHIYAKNGEYIVKATSYDTLSNSSSSLTFPISSKDCTKPEIDIRDQHKYFNEPKIVYKSDSIQVSGTTRLTCAITYDNKKVWKLSKINEKWGVVDEDIDVSSLDTVNNADLSLPPIYLDYGLYRFTFEVSIKIGPDVFSSSISTYLKVVKTPLIGLMVKGGMTQIQAGLGKNLTLNPKEFSRDPDVAKDADQGIADFIYFCRQTDEEFPLDDNGDLSTENATAPPTDAQLQSPNFVDGGGCFRQGPGAVHHSAVHDGALTFDTSIMHPNETYNITVKMTKGNRTTFASVLVDITEGDPLNVELSCKDDLWRHTPTEVYVRATIRLPLVATCNGVACPKNSVFIWKIYRQGLDANTWLDIDNLQRFASDLNSDEVAIHQDLFKQGFEMFENLTTYRIHLEVRVPGREPGGVFTTIHLNTAPKPGGCILSNTDITFPHTIDITCENFTDSDGIANYQYFLLEPGQKTKENHFYFGLQSSLSEIEIPIGKYELDYSWDMWVRVSDTLGASVDHKIGKIYVRPNLTYTDNLVKESLSSTSEFERIAAEGDVTTMAESFTSFAASISQLNEDLESQYSNVGIASAGTGFSNGSTYQSESKVDNTTKTKEQLTQEYEEKRDELGQVITQMSGALSKATISDTASTMLVTSTLNVVTAQPKLLSRDTQENIADTVENIVVVLQSKESETPLEDFKRIAQQMTSIIGNTLSASSFAAQSDTNGLITDQKNAKKSEDYIYETDINSQRKEVSESADNAGAILAGETNTIVQGNSMSKTTVTLLDSMKSLGRFISKKTVAGEEAFVVKQPFASFAVVKTNGSSLSKKVPDLPGVDVQFPTTFCDLFPDTNCSDSEVVGVQTFATPGNVYEHLGDAVNSSSPLISTSLTGPDGEELIVQGATSPISITLHPNYEIPVPEALNLTEKVNTTSINLREGDGIYIEIDQHTTKMLVLIRHGQVPVLNDTTNLWDYVYNIPRCLAQRGHSDNVIVIPSSEIGTRTGTWYIMFVSLEDDDWCKYNDLTIIPSSVVTPANFSVEYLAMSLTCSYVDRNRWSKRGLTITAASKPKSLVCESSHLTTFGSGFIVQPNKIDFSYVFSNMDFAKNPTIYITLIIITVTYIICAIWARRKDKKDILKMGVCPLLDNSPSDKYLYEVVVSTGMRKNAGTDSQVRFIISGDYDETDPHLLADTKRKVLRRGAVDRFLLATPRPLGKLNYMQVWHDNSGKGKFAGWYLNYIAVQDLQNKQKFFFIANRWFAVEEDDGQVDRLLPVAGEEQVTEFGNLFPAKAAQNLGDEHLWFSVFARPPSSRFTGLQRVSCCLCLLYTSMLANALFYGLAPEGEGNHGINFGPFSLTPGQIYVGVITNLIVFPINFLVVWVFRKSSPRSKRKSRIREAMRRQEEHFKKQGIYPDDMPIPSCSKDDMKPIIKEEPSEEPVYTKPLRPSSAFEANYDPDSKPQTTSVDIQEDAKEKQKSEAPKKRFALPWWCLIVGWVLLWMATFVSMAFVLFFGVQFGDHKTKQWITSLIVSFLTSIFLTQPIKVFLVALLFSIIFKKADIDDADEEEDEEDHGLSSDEVWLHSLPTKERTAEETRLARMKPNADDLARSREQRIKELQMYDILREILLYSFFLWILLVISYGFRDPAGFFYKDHLMKTFNDQGLGEYSTASNSFEKVRTYDNWFSWAETVMIPALRAGRWYNGQPPFGMRGFIIDGVSRMMGYATLRQLRIKPDLCDPADAIAEYVPTCRPTYSIFDEETKHFDVGWKPLSGANASTEAPEGFKYFKGSDIESWPIWGKHALYSGGGYLVNLTGEVSHMLEKLAFLKENEWIDGHTKAIFLEFTVYNPMVNLFGVCTFVSEFLTSGGLDYYSRVEPMNLLGFFAGAMLFQLICQLMYLVFIIVFIIKEIRKIFRQRKKYFLEPWNWIELAIIAFSIAAVVVYFYRFWLANDLTQLFEESAGNDYMKFQYIGYWNQMLLYMVGWLVFLATLKFIRLLRFNKRMGNLSMTLRYAATSMLGFGMMFGIVFMAYAQFFYLIFSIELLNFSTLIRSIETLLQMLVGKFNFNAMAGSSPVLGPLFFFCYVVTVYYILINMFLTILNEAFAAVRQDVDKQSNEYEMVDFIIQRFKSWTGIGSLLGSSSKSNDKIKKKDPGIGDFETSIEHFPDTVDRLMNCISNVYFDYDQFEALFLSSGVNSKEAMRQIRQGKMAMRGMKSGHED